MNPNPTYDVTCVIPRWGRTFQNIMTRFAEISDNREEILEVIKIVSQGKKEATPDSVLARQNLKNYASPYIALAPDRKRTSRPYRIGFLGMDITIAGVKLRLEGDEPHNGSSLIKLDEVDFTIVGLDELLAMNQHYLTHPEKVSKWGLYNYNIATDTDLRIAGSANLTSFNATAGKEIVDFVGFFLITNRDLQNETEYTYSKIIKKKLPVYVKGRYEGLVHKLLPGINTISTENVEDAVLESNSGSGIEIIQSGSTIRSKGLKVCGPPLFLSESLYVADYHRYLANEKFQQLLEILNPLGYFDQERIIHYVEWFQALEKNLGTAWFGKPDPAEIFCSLSEMENGLRPYRLKTRRWTPSDEYKVAEATILVKESLAQITSLYKT